MNKDQERPETAEAVAANKAIADALREIASCLRILAGHLSQANSMPRAPGCSPAGRAEG